jgi:hypothetical protein
MKNSPYLDRPLLPLAVALPRFGCSGRGWRSGRNAPSAEHPLSGRWIDGSQLTIVPLSDPNANESRQETPRGPLFSAEFPKSHWVLASRCRAISTRSSRRDQTAPRGVADPFLASVPRALGSDMAGSLFTGCGVVAIGLSSACDRSGGEEPPKRARTGTGDFFLRKAGAHRHRVSHLGAFGKSCADKPPGEWVA